MWLVDSGKLAVINDDDFGIKSANGDVVEKIVPSTQKQETNMIYQYSIVLP